MALDCAAVLQPLTRHINTRDLLQLARGFSDTYRDLAQQSTQHFLATPVTALPTGRETGTFLAIDVGGTNLRVGFVKLLGEAGEQNDDSNSTSRHHVPDRPAKIHRCHERAWPIEEHLKMDQADDLFIWIGDCIAAVVREALDDATLRIKDLDAIPLGITFSFPMKQDAISQATLMPMGKGFAITSDLNLGKMLLAGYARHCANGFISPQKATPTLPKLRIAAITNDTVATYASLAYSIKVSSNSRVVMGLVVGTGTNATVPMTVDSLGSFKTQFLDLPTETSPQDAKIVVNTEWSVCGTDIPLKQLQVPTIWDAELDRACDAPGFQPVEYMTAGRYLGELVRLVLVQLLPEQCGCGTKDDLPPTLMRRNSLSTKFLATVVALADDAELKRSLEELYPPRSASGGSFAWTKERMGLLRAAAAAVQVRSAALVAAMIVGLLARVGEVYLDGDDDAEDTEADANAASSSPGAPTTGEAEEQLIVAHTGGVILQYPGYLEDCEKWIDTLLAAGSRKNSSKRVVLGEAKDGGVIGAAVLAGMFAEAR
ncbi:Hexokinase [Lasiodiplodia theobromae]|uniref:Phosphotransferase n=1 Tax=Lasiodiplodia theobromae TaxID=45133 RepID=A0A5N5D7G4_9PEZI|nr:Glucokinase-1 [Lasiodiplodia theobromae]KAF9631032.1 Hexokinase [Lasiodiplodia theobromae]